MIPTRSHFGDRLAVCLNGGCALGGVPSYPFGKSTFAVSIFRGFAFKRASNLLCGNKKSAQNKVFGTVNF